MSIKIPYLTGKRTPIGKQVASYNPIEDHGDSTVGTIICRPALASAALNSAGIHKFRLERSYFEKIIRSAMLRFTVGESGGNSFVPAPVGLWFSRIELWTLDSSQGGIQTLYDQNLYSSVAHLTEEQTKIWADHMAYDPDSFGLTQYSVPANSSGQYFYLPLIQLMTNHARLHISDLKGDLELRFYTKSEGIVASGTGVPSLLEVALRVDTLDYDKKNEMETKALSTRSTQLHHYIDVQDYSFPAQTYSASTTYKMSLEQFNNRAVMLKFCLRSSNLNTAGAGIKYVDLHDSQVDLKSAAGKSIFGRGTPVYASYLKKMVGHRVFSTPAFCKYNSLYVLPFCHDPDETVTQFDISGYHEFKNDKQILEITTSAAPTFYTQTITQDSAATGGSILLGYKGEFARIAFNASATTIGDTLTALRTVQSERLAITANAAFSAGTAVILTFKQLDGSFTRPDARVQYVPCANLTGATYGTTTVSQNGTPGFVAGSYVLDIWVYYIRSLYNDSGKLTSRIYGREDQDGSKSEK